MQKTPEVRTCKNRALTALVSVKKRSNDLDLNVFLQQNQQNPRLKKQQVFTSETELYSSIRSSIAFRFSKKIVGVPKMQIFSTKKMVANQMSHLFGPPEKHSKSGCLTLIWGSLQ